MKRYVLIGIVFFLLIALIGCAQDAEDIQAIDVDPVVDPVDGYDDTIQEDEVEIFASPVADMLIFSSVEELLAGYILAKESRAGSGIADLGVRADSAFADMALANIADSVNFSALETFHLPVGIPEDFQVQKITITEGHVSFWFLHEDDMVSEDAIFDAISRQRHFLLSVTRVDTDTDLLIDGFLRQDGVTREALIDGKYLFSGQNSFIWASDRELFLLYTPIEQDDSWLEWDGRGEIPARICAISGVELTAGNAADMVYLAETRTINLLDTHEVVAMIAELADEASWVRIAAVLEESGAVALDELQMAREVALAAE